MPKETAFKKQNVGFRLDPILKARVERVAKANRLGSFSQAMRFAAVRLCEFYEACKLRERRPENPPID